MKKQNKYYQSSPRCYSTFSRCMQREIHSSLLPGIRNAVFWFAGKLHSFCFKYWVVCKCSDLWDYRKALNDGSTPMNRICQHNFFSPDAAGNLVHSVPGAAADISLWILCHSCLLSALVYPDLCKACFSLQNEQCLPV